MLPESWSGEDKMSFFIALGGVLPVLAGVAGILRVVYSSADYIDPLSADILSLAAILGIPGIVFGLWMCLRKIGHRFYRFAALGLGCAAMAAWPAAIYISGLSR